MRQGILTCMLVSLAVVTAQRVMAQTMVNPDISAIADMRYVARNDVARELAGSRPMSFEFQELELAISAYLNPYSRADLYISTGLEGPVEIEEVYATLLRGLPVQARFGKYKLDVGKVNTQHAHQWGWMEVPLMLRSLLGPEGAAAEAIGVSRLQPVGDSALELSVTAFRAGFFQVDEALEDSTDVAGSSAPKIGYSGRLSFFRSLTEFTHFEVGVSYLFATYDPSSDLDTQVGGLDFKLKWRPDAYRSFTVVGEAMLSERETEDAFQKVSAMTAGGAFGMAELRFRKRFDIGAYIDWAEDAEIPDVETVAGGAYLGFMPVEETIRFSVVYRHETSDFYEGGNDTVSIQVLWSVGPHKPHQF